MMETERQEKIETSRKLRKRHGVGQCLLLNPSYDEGDSRDSGVSAACGWQVVTRKGHGHAPLPKGEPKMGLRVAPRANLSAEALPEALSGHPTRA